MEWECVCSEAFFKYKSKCVENDRLLRKKRVSFFAGLGLAADPGDTNGHEDRSFQSTAHQLTIIPQQAKRRRLSRNGAAGGGELGNEDEEEQDPAVDRKRHRTGLPDDAEGSCLKKPHNGEANQEEEAEEEEEEEEREVVQEEDDGREADHKVDLGPYQIKQEAIDADGDDEDENRNPRHLLEEDDEEEYFNPNQFLAQETQIDEGEEVEEEEADNDTNSDGDGQFVPNGTEGGAAIGHPFERGWKTTEFSPQPGSSGLKTLKITDYSNITGKRGRPQRFVTDMLSMAVAASGGGGGGNIMLPYHPGDAMYQQWQRLKGLTSERLQAEGMARLSLTVGNSPQGSTTTRILGGVIEPTKKVQKFLDDGLRELIYNAGAPNPHYARDGGSTDFKVVKARFNSYNIIFDDNRFLRRNKSVSGLPKWYWACSVTGCPVKICSYAGRLFKTNELSHTHPPTEPDADSKYETIQPDPIEAEQLQRQLLLQQQQQHQLQQQRLLRQQQQQQLLRQRQVELAQRRVAAAAALMAAAAANTSRSDFSELEHSRQAPDSSNSNIMAEQTDPRRNYELRMANDGSEMLLYAGHTHGLIMTRKDGVRVYRCRSVVGGENQTTGQTGRPCTDTVFVHTNGYIAKVCKEENVDYEMVLPVDGGDRYRSGGGSVVADGEDDKRRRPQKIIVYEGYRYKYCHARPEGSFYWRCVLRHDKDCLASIQTKRNLEFINVNDQPHNHEPPDPAEPHENAMLCEIRLPAKGEPTEGSTDFKLVKSGQKREFLIYKGYRYYFQYESKNGRRSYRCTMFKNCPAGAFLLPNSTIQEAKNFIHTHPPVEDMDKYITKDSLITSPIKLPTDGGMDGTGGGKRSVDSSAWKNASMGGNTAGIEPLSKDPEVARRNGYRIIKNYKNKEIMIYLGWRYFEDYKKKSGGQVWRCSSHRLCRGSVHLFPDGSINFAKLVDHNHSPPKKIISHSSVDGGYTKSIVEGSSLDQQLALGVDGTSESMAAGGGTYHRYITHQGHRFRFATRKREGTIYWRCAMRLETKCPVSFHTKEDTYELVSTRNHEHNHPIPTVWPEVAGGQIDEELPKVRLPAEEVGTTDFILTKNSKGRDLVLYRNGRFYLDYSRKDGKIVFRCSAVSGCRATVLLLPNKTLQVPEDFSHNHPTADGWDAGEATSFDGKSIGQQMTEPIELKSDDEDEDGELTNRIGERPRMGAQESMLPKIILYDGFQFRFISRHPTEQSAFFRCFNFDAKKHQCHASLYTDLNGVVIQTNRQPHNHEQGDYLNGPDKYLQRSHQQDQSMPLQLNGADLRGTRDYKIVKNWKNRDVLVFQNCRYFLHYVRKDGRKVWRCSAIRSCHAAVYLNADGTVDQFRGQHVHEIRPEGEPRRRRRRKKSELMPLSYGVVGSGTGSIFANGGLIANAAELMARGLNGALGISHGGPVVNGSINGGGHNAANEWIDYSDYGIQMSGSPNDTAGSGNGGGVLRPNDENHSLWEQFHPAEGGSGRATNGGEGFDLSYHSVFGSQENFNTYAVHALAQHHLQQQHQRSAASLQQQLQHHLLMNGGGGQQQAQRDSTQPQDSSDAEEYDLSGGGTGSSDEHPMIDITPEVKIEGDEL
uniref:FLYWCH-type domain-containing protein n=1 Tax=Anopheles christyi TaxID=43041 RepID=A0A182K7D5_9DIPT